MTTPPVALLLVHALISGLARQWLTPFMTAAAGDHKLLSASDQLMM